MNLPKNWVFALSEYITQHKINEIQTAVKNEIQKGKIIFPELSNIYKAFELTHPENIKVVIVGQDPYFKPGQANGLSFAVNEGTPLPPSLQNIYKALKSDFKSEENIHLDLINWAKQGVLMLNSILTVEQNKPSSHKNFGWDKLTDAVIKCISDKKTQTVFLLWGNFAIEKSKLINEESNLILNAPHPSPLSAHRGFINCKHFSKTNDHLVKNNKKPIKWT